jgi:hypothetical protein
MKSGGELTEHFDRNGKDNGGIVLSCNAAEGLKTRRRRRMN